MPRDAMQVRKGNLNTDVGGSHLGKEIGDGERGWISIIVCTCENISTAPLQGWQIAFAGAASGSLKAKKVAKQ